MRTLLHILGSIAYAFQLNREYRQHMKRARRAGIDTKTDAEFRATNDL